MNTKLVVRIDLLTTARTSSTGKLLLDVAIVLQDRMLDSLPISLENIGPADGTTASGRQRGTHAVKAEGRMATGL